MNGSEPPQPAEGQCAFFLPKKRRFCRFRPNPGQKYCPEHACVLGVALERKRIVCPLNPKHTCYEDNLDKHLKKCNSRKRTAEVYYEEGINAGSEEGDSVKSTQTAVKATDTERLKQMIDKVNRLYEEHIGRVEEDIRSHECLRQEMDNPYFGLSALRHRRQQASLIGQLEGLGLLAPGHCYVEMGAGKGQLSHWVRQAVSSHDDAAFLLVDRSSIRYKVDGYHKEEEKVKFERIKVDIEHLCLGKVPMVASSERPLVAMGKHLCGAATDLTLRCLMETMNRSLDTTSEPSPKRSRTDDNTSTNPTECVTTTLTSSQSLSTDCSEIDRSQSSSANCTGGVNPKTVSEASVEQRCEGKDGVVDRGEEISGDMAEDGGRTVSGQCGGEKDCQEKSDRSDSWLSSQETRSGTNDDSSKRIQGVLIALCCHHQCTWRAYVGKQFMRQCHITADDFHLLTRLTSWAVCGWRDRDGSFGTKENTPTSTSMQEGKGDSSTADPSVEQTSSQKGDNNGTEDETEHNTADLVNSNDKEDGLQLTEKQKEAVGWRCKRLIDYGRLCYLQDQGLCANLKVYIDTQQTPENVVLVAMPTVSS